MFDMMASQGAPEGMDNISDMLKEMMPKRKKKRTVKVSEARRILFEQELEKLIDLDDVTADALERVEKMGIIFLDEIDKIAGERSQMGGPDVSREGVQRDLLPIVEGSNVQTKYGMVKTDHVLFIAAGAFHVSKPSDLIPELQGRFPDSRRAQAAHRAGLRAHHDGAGERAHQAVRRARRGGRREARVHGRRHRRDRAHRRAGQRAHGEHRRAPAAHGDDDAARGRAVRPAGPRHGDDHRRRGDVVRDRLKAIVEDEDLRKYIL